MIEQLNAGAALVDLPWPGQGTPYDTVSIKRLFEFPLLNFMAPSSQLYVWVPANHLVTVAVRWAESYGYKVRGVITWVKTRPGRPTRYLQANTELLLFCTVGGSEARVKGQPTILFAPTQLTGQKPEEQYVLVDRLSGHPPYIEFFARTAPFSKDWITWGGELEASAIQVPQWPTSADFLQEAAK
jgi:N6-adenosine-specific RNA methylase IME4